ncbi:Heterokaryon incompatibility protein (HET) domain containing protein [Hyaloscypha variabilis]
MLCAFCTRLSISDLIELAEVEFESRQSPRHAYYKHFDSYNDLVQSARDGCDLCQFIWSGFKNCIVDTWPWDGQNRDEAVREIEYRGEEIDIRISIDADHLYSGRGLDQVALFDLLVIQAGAPVIKYKENEGSEESEGSEGSEQNISIPPLLVKLSVPRDKQIRIGKYPVGRYQLDPVLESQNNFSIARGWLEECCNTHQSCPFKRSLELPARVIDVGNLGDEQRLRLVHSHSSTGQYAALSHCWGGLIPKRLLADTLDYFQKDIPFSSLPANFRDAVTITRQLGIKYLWIDALCIIQDSTSDWEIESKKMGDVYRNALITISAAMSPGSTAGIFPKTCTPEVLKENEMADSVSLKVSYDGNSGTDVYVSLNDKEDESLRDLFISSPLSRRGWVLQESILSPRILHYGRRQIYWQCPQGFQSADGVPAGNLMPEDTQLYSAISNVFYQDLQRDLVRKSQHDRRLILTDYYNLVEEYSSRKLTYNSDKFPAFSGIARLLHPVVGGSYLAGVWSNDFAQGLCWHSEMLQCRHTLSDEAPFWSWAVTTDLINFAHVERKDSRGLYDSKLIQRDAEVQGENPYGQVKSGSLVIEGLVKTFRRSRQVISMFPSEHTIGRIYMDEFEIPDNELESNLDLFQVNEVDGQTYLLSVVQPTSSPKEDWTIDFDLISPVSYIALILVTRDEEYEGRLITSAQALVLRKVTNEVRKSAGSRKADIERDNGTEREEECFLYERVGYISTIHRYEAGFKRWMGTWERKSVTII